MYGYHSHDEPERFRSEYSVSRSDVTFLPDFAHHTAVHIRSGVKVEVVRSVLDRPHPYVNLVTVERPGYSGAAVKHSPESDGHHFELIASQNVDKRLHVLRSLEDDELSVPFQKPFHLGNPRFIRRRFWSVSVISVRLQSEVLPILYAVRRVSNAQGVFCGRQCREKCTAISVKQFYRRRCGWIRDGHFPSFIGD